MHGANSVTSLRDPAPASSGLCCRLQLLQAVRCHQESFSCLDLDFTGAPIPGCPVVKLAGVFWPDSARGASFSAGACQLLAQAVLLLVCTANLVLAPKQQCAARLLRPLA